MQIQAGIVFHRKTVLLTVIVGAVFIGAILFGVTQNAYSDTTGLVAAYNFDELSGPTVLDASGNNNNGTITGAARTITAKYGQALSFTGSHYVTIPDAPSLDLTNSMTIEAWVRPTSLSSWRTIILKENGSEMAYGLYASGGSNRPSGWVRINPTTGDSQSVYSSSALTTNTWNHIATTYDGTSLKIYKNGILVGTRNQTGNMYVSGNPLRIGGNLIWGEYFRGQIDDVRVYNRALTQTEIQSDMNTPVNSTPDTTPPTISLTNPLDGSVATGTIAVSATASDDRGIAGVQFFLDYAPLGSEDTLAPYSVNWNTGTASNTTHILYARARDAAGNIATTSSVTVTVSNPPKLIITLPTNGSILSTTTVFINYTTQGDLTGVDHVHFYVDDGTERMDRSFDGVHQLTSIPPGSHTLNGFLVNIDHIEIPGTEADPINFTITLPDTNPPFVAITSPIASSTLSGTVTVAATSTDNVGVAGVQFLLDGGNLGAEDTTAPYSTSWNTTLINNGNHTLTARSRDAAGNITVSDPIPVTVQNSNTPADIGQWSAPVNIPTVAVHTASVPNGNIIFWKGQGQPTNLYEFNPTTNSVSSTPTVNFDIFCAGHVLLADGRLFIIGGDSTVSGLGIRETNIYNSTTRTWFRADDMTYKRWYPTGLTLSDGRVFTLSGSDESYRSYVSEPEIYNPQTNVWSTFPTSANYTIPMYPFLFQLADGRILSAGSYEGTVDTRAFNLTTNTWSIIDPVAIDAGSAVQYAPGKFMKVGKWASADAPFEPSHARTYVLDMNAASPAWRQTASMNFPRAYHVTTLLPDGTTLVTGGGRNTDHSDNSAAVFEAEIWSPETETWTTMARNQIPRLYHGTAQLLQDGRVFVSGGGGLSPMTDRLNYEIFSPPYLFKGPRPTITSAPSVVAHGSEFAITSPDAAAVAKVTMVRIGTMTHSFNPDQRFFDVPFTVNGNTITATAPANPNVATPGHYMVFILNAQGVPSVAAMTRMPTTVEDNILPTAPANLQVVGGLSSAQLTWDAATDNSAVTKYNIHRSTVSGFTPSIANRVGQVNAPTLSFNNSNLAAGTYYYVVTAEDAAGNIGPGSNEASAVVVGDTEAPTAPTNLSATSTSASQINLSWASSTDNVSVAGYQVFRNGVQITTTTTTSYSNTGLTASTTYSYTVKAFDGAGNVSVESNQAEATTQAAPPQGSDITVDASSPARVTSSGQVATTAGFNPPSNSLLVAVVNADSNTSNVNGITTITNNGTPLTWSPIVEREDADSNAGPGYVSAYYAVLPTERTDMTVTGTISGSSLANISMKVYVVTGANLSSPIGASIEGSSTANNLTTVAYTSTAPNSLGFAAGTDWSANGVPTSLDIENGFHSAGFISGLSAYKSSVTSPSGSPVSLNLDAGGTGAAQWNWISFEIK